MGKKMRKYLFAAAIVAAGANSALAASSSGTFNVQVKIAAACTISATAMNFGTVTGSVLGSETASSTVSVGCNKGTTYNVSFSALSTLGTPLTTASINLNNGVNVIPAGLTISAGSTGTATGGVDSATVSGLLTATANPTPGTYSNTQTIYVVY